jgi:adenylate cyclase
VAALTEGAAAVKIPFRSTMLASLLALTLFTGAGLGVVSYVSTRQTADDLSRRVLDEAALRVDRRIAELVHAAEAQGRLGEKLIGDGRLRADDFPTLARYWVDVMTVRTELANIYLTLEADGRTVIVTRQRDKTLAVQELAPSKSKPGRMALRSFRPADYPAGKPFFEDPARGDLDQRDWDWYADARRTGSPGWTETYMFFDSEGVYDIPGVTYAVPVYGADKQLVGVLGVDFDVLGLCEFLREVPVSAHGGVFVAERRADGSRRVIAHPNEDFILARPGGPGSLRLELRRPEDIPDPRVAALLAGVPADLDPNTVQETRRADFSAGGAGYLGAYRGPLDADCPRWLVCLVVPESDVLATAHFWDMMLLLLGVLVVGVAGLAGMRIARQVAGPLENVHRETEAIARFDVAPRPVERSFILEVDRLAVATEDMKASLRSFRRYVPARLVSDVLASGREAVLGGEERTLTVFFCDLANFTTLAEELAPQALVEQLGEYFQAFSEEIVATGGTVDKYIGDAVMAFWGAPQEDPGHAAAACRAALRCQARLAALRGRWAAAGKPPFRARVGLNTGPVVVGNIGSEARFNYTVIGDPVNVASRLEGLNKFFGTSALVSEATYRAAGGAAAARPLGRVAVKGKSAPVLVYELLGMKGEVETAAGASAETFARALDAYHRRDGAAAVGLLEGLLAARPDDEPALRMLARCQTLLADPPGPEWDGVVRMESK